MKRRILAFAILFASGCAADFEPGSNDLAVKDFSPTDHGPADDLSQTTDLGVVDQASPDLRIVAIPDLLVPPDLTTLMCDLGPASGSDGGSAGKLYVAAVSGGKALVTSEYDPVLGTWSASAIDGSQQVNDVVIATSGPRNQPLVVARLASSVLYAAAFQPCLAAYAQLAPVYQQLDTSTNRPSLIGGLTPDLIFKGSNNGDQHLYHTQFDGAAWSAAAQQATFLTTLDPAAVRVNAAVHAIHTGTDSQLYDGLVGGAAVTITGATSSLSPAAVTGLDSTLHVVFVGTNTNLYYASRASGAGAYSAPAIVCVSGTCLATTDKTPSLALTATGAPIVAFHGTDNHIYTSALAGAVWSSPIEATGGELTTLPPAIASGVGAAAAELVYVRTTDGYLRHTRLSTTWATAITVSPTAVSAAPALASVP